MKAKTPTTLEYALLGLLHQQPQSGYDLRKIFATTALGNYSSSPGVIYPALKRLESRGLVTGRIDDAKELRPRKLFEPTKEGKAIFREWLNSGVTQDEVARGLDRLMLRFAFHSVLDDPGATRDFLIELGTHLDSYVEELEAQRKLIPEQAPLQPRLALEAGIEQCKAAARWAHNAAEKFKEEKS